MKTVNRFNLIVLAAFLTLLACASAYTQQLDSSLCGAWANLQSADNIQKLVINHNGTFVGYNSQNATTPASEGNIKIVEMWSDAEGSHWYRSILTHTEGQKNYAL